MSTDRLPNSYCPDRETLTLHRAEVGTDLSQVDTYELSLRMERASRIPLALARGAGGDVAASQHSCLC